MPVCPCWLLAALLWPDTRWPHCCLHQQVLQQTHINILLVVDSYSSWWWIVTLHTWSLHEGAVQPEGDERFFQFSQKVFKKTTDHMDVVDFTEHERRFPLNESISELLHQTLPSRNSVQTPLQTDISTWISAGSQLGCFQTWGVLWSNSGGVPHPLDLTCYHMIPTGIVLRRMVSFG